MVYNYSIKLFLALGTYMSEEYTKSKINPSESQIQLSQETNIPVLVSEWCGPATNPYTKGLQWFMFRKYIQPDGTIRVEKNNIL